MPEISEINSTTLPALEASDNSEESGHSVYVERKVRFPLRPDLNKLEGVSRVGKKSASMAMGGVETVELRGKGEKAPSFR